MKFSICIPNYNYESYLGETIASVLTSSFKDFEIVISDNASTDDSVGIVRKIQEQHSNIKLQINPSNVGFASNLDCSARMADGDYMIMLSSDDLMTPRTLSIYHDMIQRNVRAVICSSWDIIDGRGKKIGFTGPNKNLWTKGDLDAALSSELNCNVYKVSAPLLLKRCLQNVATPFNFCTAAYAKEWYHKVGGYGGGRLINPDKWFHWKLLSVADEAIFIDMPLFRYRWHSQNQTSQQAASGYLKYLVDEYRNVIEISPQLLNHANMERAQFERYFIQRDIYKHGIGEFIKGRWLKSFKVFFFGLSTFPGLMIRNIYFIPFLFALLTTPIGSKLVSFTRKKNELAA